MKSDSTLRTVLVTGGSRGIGAACSLLCAQQGWAVAVNYTRDAGAARTVVERIRAAGGTALEVQADVSNEAQVLAMFATLDMPASSTITRQRLGWQPTGPGLIADLERAPAPA